MEATRLFVFHVQGASGLEVKKWKLTPTGLLYDIWFLISDDEGVKVETTIDKAVALIHPCIEKDELVLKIHDEEFIVNCNGFEEDRNALEAAKKQRRVYAVEVNKFITGYLKKCVFLVSAYPWKVGKMVFSNVHTREHRVNRS